MDAANLAGDPALQAMREIDRRIIAHLVQSGSADLAPTSMTLSPSEYTSSDRAARELQMMFRKSPLVVCLSCDVSKTGDVFLFDELGVSIIVACSKTGQVNGFLNMCTHRAARLVNDCKARPRFSCPFHGWTFDLNGKLIGLPDQESFPDVDRALRGLIRVPVTEAHGIVFLVPSASADAIRIEDYLGEFGPVLEHLKLRSARLIKTDRVETDANWKYVLDTYEESYHNAVLHPRSFGENFHNFIVYSKFGVHQRVNFVMRTYDDLLGRDEHDWPARPYGGGHLVFPNTIINGDTRAAGDSQVLVVRIYPLGPNRCSTYFSTYRIGDSLVPDDEHVAVHDLTVKIVTEEDYSVSQEGQRNLRQAPDGFTTVFGRNEIALQEFHRNVALAIGG